MPDAARRQWVEERVAVLQGPARPEALATAATDLASSDDPEALEALGAFLSRSELLDRLDEAGSSNGEPILFGVLRALIAAPSPEVARLCLKLVDEPIYLEHDRKSLVLEALAAVVPMTAETAEAFRRANEEGYFAFDALRLADNGSPVALELFRSMMGDRNVDAEGRVELVHKGVMPYRTRPAVLKMVSDMLGDGLEEPVTVAAIESVFDYKPEWFTLHGPMPPPWRIAPNDALRDVIELGGSVKRRPNLPATLLPAIEATTEIARALLNARAA